MSSDKLLNYVAFLIEANDKVGDGMEIPFPGTLAELADKYSKDKKAWEKLEWKNKVILEEWRKKWLVK